MQREKTQMIPNPADTSCLEIALRMREERGAHVSVLSMGPPGALEMLRNLAAVGGDAFYLVSDPVFAGADTYATATVLSRAVNYLGGFDRILCGDKSTDGETGQVGAELAAILGYGFSAMETCDLLRQIGSEKDRKGTLPRVVVLRRSCVLRRPSLAGLRRASGIEIRVLTAEMLGGAAVSLTRVVGMERRVIRRRKVVFCQGGKQLWELLRTDALLTKASSADSATEAGEHCPAEIVNPVKAGAARGKWMLIRPPGTSFETFEELRQLAGKKRRGEEILEIHCVGPEGYVGRLEGCAGGMEGCARGPEGYAGRLEGCAGGTEEGEAAGRSGAAEWGESAGEKREITAKREEDKVRIVRSELFRCQDVTLTGGVLAEVIRQEAPSVILFAGDAAGKRVAAWIAGKLGIGLTAELTDFGTDEEGRLHQFRWGYGASCRAEIVNCNGSITMATVKGKRAESGLVIAGGLGAGEKGFRLLRELAELTGGTLGATRAAVDAGLAPFSCQIGQSGIYVSPKLYMAFGISGAVQHIAGMKDSVRVLAVNTDRKAPIFDYADYGICGDAAETAAELIRQIRAK